MERKFKITVEGRAYNVTVEELTEIANSNHLDGISHARPAQPITSLAPASLPAQPATPARLDAEPGDVVSALGGVVDSVNVTVGQDINEGDRVLVIEAMKMKTPVAAHRAGKVSAILVKAGDGVESGQVLVKIS